MVENSDVFLTVGVGFDLKFISASWFCLVGEGVVRGSWCLHEILEEVNAKVRSTKPNSLSSFALCV